MRGLSVAVAGAVSSSTEVKEKIAGGATSEVPDPDLSCKIVGHISVRVGAVALDREATVLVKKFWKRPVEFVTMACLLRQPARQRHEVHLLLASRHAQPSRKAVRFIVQVDVRLQPQQGCVTVLGRDDGRGLTSPLSISPLERRLLASPPVVRRTSSVLSVPIPPWARSEGVRHALWGWEEPESWRP